MWNKLWTDKDSDEDNSVENENYGIVEDLTSFFDAIAGFEPCEASDAEDWLNCSANDQGIILELIKT